MLLELDVAAIGVSLVVVSEPRVEIAGFLCLPIGAVHIYFWMSFFFFFFEVCTILDSLSLVLSSGLNKSSSGADETLCSFFENNFLINGSVSVLSICKDFCHQQGWKSTPPFLLQGKGGQLTDTNT